jgi:hypothetical protein
MSKNPTVVGLEVRTAPQDVDPWVRSYGVIDEGFEAMRAAWPELTTSSLFFVPRTVPAFWWGLSRHLVELPSIYPHLTPLRYQPRLPIPIVVLYI